MKELDFEKIGEIWIMDLEILRGFRKFAIRDRNFNMNMLSDANYLRH